VVHKRFFLEDRLLRLVTLLRELARTQVRWLPHFLPGAAFFPTKQLILHDDVKKDKIINGLLQDAGSTVTQFLRRDVGPEQAG